MPTSEFVCPECHAKARSPKPLPDGAAIRCPKCGVVFRLGGAPSAVRAAEPKPAAPKPAVLPKSSPAVRETPDEAPPARKSAPRPDDRSAVRRNERDDDEDIEDRPRKKKSKKSKPSSSMPLILAIGGAAVLAVGVVVALILVFVLKSKEKETTNVATSGIQNENPTIIPPAPNLPGRPIAATTRPSSSLFPATKTESPPAESGSGSASPAGSGSVQDIYQYVLKSTVLIVNVMPNGAALGTGSVVDANERLILTNFHVVANSARLVVFFPTYEGGKLISEKERYLNNLKKGTKAPEDLIQGEVLATDTMRDLALIRVPKLPAGTEALPLAKGVVNIGQTVHSVGNPGASGALWVYTQGAVRAVYRKKWRAGGGDLLLTLEAEVVETQSPTNPGDSGGPLVNDRGELVGVTEGGSTEAHLLSIFISLSEARDFIEREYQRKQGKPWSPLARAPLHLRGGGGADVTALINALDHKDAKNRASAARSLGDMGPDAKLAIRRLVKALKDSDDLTCRASAEALTKIGAPGRDDLPALIEALKDAKPEVRRYASGAIGQIGPEAASAAGQLADALSDGDERVRESLVRSLGSLGPSAKSAAMPGLTKALQDSSKSVRVAAATAVTNLLTPPTADDVPLLVSILKQQDPEASVFGARALAKLGKQAKAAIPDLMEAAKNSDPGVRRGAIDSLAAIGPDAKAAVPLFVTALKDGSDNSVRQSALLALGQMGKDLGQDKDAIAAVLEAVKDSDNQVKKAALAAVGKLGGAVIGAPGAKQVMPAVIDALQDKAADLRDQAMEAVAGIGPQASEAVGTLITMLDKQDVKLLKNTQTGQIIVQDADDLFMTKVAKTLGKVGQPAVKPLLGSLNTTNLNFGLLIGACRALGEVGPPAKQAMSALRAISQSNLPPPVCFEADRALRKIQTK